MEFTPESDASPGDWIAPRLLEWGSKQGTPAGAIIPTGLEAYARIFHDADGRRWADIAREHGTTFHPAAAFTRLLGVHWSERPAGCPTTGALRLENARALVEAVRPFTTEPCYFGLWRGYGWIEGGATPLRSRPTTIRGRLALARAVRNEGRARQRRRRELDAVPLVRVPNRDYFLFRGPLELVLNGPWTRWDQTPNLWWPPDRAWFVATEIDFDSTVVGGARALIDAVLASADLEALEIAPDMRLDWYGDELNPAPEDA